MAHRIYIYNIDFSTGESYPNYLGEWNYELPPLLLPLFGHNIRSKRSQLYADRKQGIELLRQFYDLLAEVYQLNSNATFTEAVHQMFTLLEELPFNTFLIEGRDVFNMNEESHSSQAKDWVLQIKENITLFEKAISTRSLDVLTDFVKSFGYESFLDALQTEWINYGLGYWNDVIYKEVYTEVFIENDLKGLKDLKNNIIVPAQYHEIYEFEFNTAIVQKDNKFGYINDRGFEIIKPIYDEAFDVFEIYGIHSDDIFSTLKVAIIVRNGAYGLINIENSLILIPTAYDNLEWLNHQYFNAKKGNSYQLIDFQNHVIINQENLEPYEHEYPNLFFKKVKGSSKRDYFSYSGVYLGSFVEDSLVALANQHYYAKQNKWQKKIVIIQPNGHLLAEDVDQILFSDNYQTLAYKKEKQWFLYDTKSEKHVATSEVISHAHFDQINHYVKDLFVLTTAVGIGMYDAKNDKWLIAPDENIKKVQHLDNEFLKITYKTGMKYWDANTHFLSPIYNHVSETYDRNRYQVLIYKEDELLVLQPDNELRTITSAEIGHLYNHANRLPTEDKTAFEQFFQKWKTKQGIDFYTLFDEDTLYQMGLNFIRENNISEAKAVYEIGASRNHAKIMTELGIMYADEENVDFYDVSKANELYKKASTLNNKDAWNNLGYHYQNGYGFEQDTQKAIEAYTQAGNLGNGLGWTNLGDLYYFGELVEKDLDIALAYYLKASKLHETNYDKLTYIYYQKDEHKKVLTYLKKDYAEAYSPIYYAIMYEEGLGGLKINIAKAISYFEKAMNIMEYPHAVKQLLFHYRKESEFENEEKFEVWLQYAEINEIEIDKVLLGIEGKQKQSLLKRLFKQKKE
ncbi:SEL1-like repeat protein [Sphingobacterium bovistauri]|uniref:SEL1-like repeat protein n=1 Tax=Sphingobacterium bovistauri TaxID=2781959 RepID=A0ABS7Z4T6_9SPHI|nr:SEL1-like repeat protein [Sphingobacterium bovistauri]MCA5005206.1 SEL1-like repeat protein [Sphingobacterium bovistauri]